LSAVYGALVGPEDTFDAILALLSATSYTTRFGRDLEDDFPHVPFPADHALFDRAAEIGSRIRALQAFAEAGERFRTARLTGQAGGRTLDIPAPARAWTGDEGVGAVALVAGGDFGIEGVSERAWRFCVSDYQVLYKWLKARTGEAFDRPLQRAILDTVGRIEELSSLYDAADEVLSEALENTLGREVLGLPSRGVGAGREAEDEPA
jgi:hypothetical protein